MKKLILPTLLSCATLSSAFASSDDFKPIIRNHCPSFVVQPTNLKVTEPHNKWLKTTVAITGGTAGAAVGLALWPAALLLTVPVAIDGLFFEKDGWSTVAILTLVATPLYLSGSGAVLAPEALVTGHKIYIADAEGHPVCKISVKGDSTEFVDTIQKLYTQAGESGQCVSYDAPTKQFNLAACPQI